MADKLSYGEKLRIRFAHELLANRDSSLVSATVHGYEAAVEEIDAELALLRELEAWSRECFGHIRGGKLESLLAKLDALRAGSR